MKRRRLGKIERATIFARQGGCCVSCSETVGLIEEHSVVFVWTGEKADQLMCVPCHKEKTRKDIKAISKVKRIQKKARGETKKKRKIAGRGFNKTKTKGFDGKVRDRG